MEEITFQCPHCWQPNSLLVDTGIRDQDFIQDCQICCNPLEIHLQVEEKENISVLVSRAQ